MSLIKIRRKSTLQPESYFTHLLDLKDISLISVATAEFVNMSIGSASHWLVILKTAYEEFFIEHKTQAEQLQFVEWLKSLKGGIAELPILPPAIEAVAANDRPNAVDLSPPRVTVKKIKKIA